MDTITPGRTSVPTAEIIPPLRGASLFRGHPDLDTALQALLRDGFARTMSSDGGSCWPLGVALRLDRAGPEPRFDMKMKFVGAPPGTPSRRGQAPGVIRQLRLAEVSPEALEVWAPLWLSVSNASSKLAGQLLAAHPRTTSPGPSFDCFLLPCLAIMVTSEPATVLREEFFHSLLIMKEEVGKTPHLAGHFAVSIIPQAVTAHERIAIRQQARASFEIFVRHLDAKYHPQISYAQPDFSQPGRF